MPNSLEGEETVNVEVSIPVIKGNTLLTIATIELQENGKLGGYVAHVNPELEATISAEAAANVLRWLADALEIDAL